MKGELKAGGLALVLRSHDEDEIGRCVTLVRLLLSGERFTAPDGTECLHLARYKPAWLVSGNVKPGTERPWLHGWAVFPPRSLMPIDGDPDQEPDQMTKDKPAELTA